MLLHAAGVHLSPHACAASLEPGIALCRPKSAQGQAELVKAATQLEARQIEMLLAEVTVSSPLQKLFAVPQAPEQGFPPNPDSGHDMPVRGGAQIESALAEASAPAYEQAHDNACSTPDAPQPGNISVLNSSSNGSGKTSGDSFKHVPILGSGASPSSDDAAAMEPASESAEEPKNSSIEESEGYQALLQLLRAKTPAELLKASSRLCMHVTDEPAAASLTGAGPSGGWLDTPG